MFGSYINLCFKSLFFWLFIFFYDQVVDNQVNLFSKSEIQIYKINYQTFFIISIRYFLLNVMKKQDNNNFCSRNISSKAQICFSLNFFTPCYSKIYWQKSRSKLIIKVPLFCLWVDQSSGSFISFICSWFQFFKLNLL